jgi:hypothetical protein
MIDIDWINSVVSQYGKFGWRFERILLKEPSEAILSAFTDVPASIGSLDALWFSRESGDGRAWELRRLTGTPFALVRVVGPDTEDQELEDVLRTVEAEMAERGVKANGENFNGK